MLRDPELAADLTQDAFVKAYRAYESLEDRDHARAWLYQIAHRVALDEFRRRKIIRFLPWTGESRGSAPSAEHLAMEARLSGELQRALAADPGAPALGPPPRRGPRPDRPRARGGPRRHPRRRAGAADAGPREPSAGPRRRASADRRRGPPARRRLAARHRCEPGGVVSDDARRRGSPPRGSPRTTAPGRCSASASLRRSMPADAAWLEEHLAGCAPCRRGRCGLPRRPARAPRAPGPRAAARPLGPYLSRHRRRAAAAAASDRRAGSSGRVARRTTLGRAHTAGPPRPDRGGHRRLPRRLDARALGPTAGRRARQPAHAVRLVGAGRPRHADRDRRRRRRLVRPCLRWHVLAPGGSGQSRSARPARRRTARRSTSTRREWRPSR